MHGKDSQFILLKIPPNFVRLGGKIHALSMFLGHPVLSKCMDSGYLVCAIPPAVLCQSFSNFIVVLSWSEDMHMVWI